MQTTDLNSYDLQYLTQKCPAFKNGCPFTGINDDKIMQAISNCPEFSKGCPFKSVKNLGEVYEKLIEIPDPQSATKRLSELFKAVHGVTEPLEQKLGDCPVFHTSGGCPFKTVHNKENISLVDPVESVAYDEGVLNALFQFKTSAMKEKCPAFATTCPFKYSGSPVDEELIEARKKCPEFKNGCPFKEVADLAEMYKLLCTIPNPHSPAKILEQLFQYTHAISQDRMRSLGKCPVFYNDNGEMSCPFKSVRSEGKHLVKPVTNVFNTQV